MIHLAGKQDERSGNFGKEVTNAIIEKNKIPSNPE
jgi:hypothetical protein